MEPENPLFLKNLFLKHNSVGHTFGKVLVCAHIIHKNKMIDFGGAQAEIEILIFAKMRIYMCPYIHKPASRAIRVVETFFFLTQADSLGAKIAFFKSVEFHAPAPKKCLEVDSASQNMPFAQV